MKKQIKRYSTTLGALVGASVLAFLGLSAQAQPAWVTGDFHQHTTYTDGANPIATVMFYNNYFGLDWWANSEHGGVRSTDGFGPIIPLGDPAMDTGIYARYWDDISVYPAGTILGDVKISGGHQQMWRWQSLRDYSFKDVITARALYPSRVVIQGVEWNMPGHEHCSIGILNGQSTPAPNVELLAAFDYLFDASDTDKTGGKAQGWEALTYNGVKNNVNNHAKAVEAAAFLNTYAPNTSWMVPTHVERARRYTINHFRDLNNAAPTVCFGFDSMPGHQKEPDRGSYSPAADGGGTYGGCGIFAAQVGGLWDALLGEGRGWWFFASSDFHSTGADFWPGEYQKTYTYVADKSSAQSMVDGLRSGNTFVVEGDLINALDFKVAYTSAAATMGQRLLLGMGGSGKAPLVEVTIRFKSPKSNNNGDPVSVDHIDLIAGAVTGLVPPTLADGTANPEYSNPVNPTTAVIARFKQGDWERDKEGWNEIKLHVKVDGNSYFRLRGTNNRIGRDKSEIDKDGNPLLDVPGTNTPEAAWADLWFYSNPIFVQVQ